MEEFVFQNLYSSCNITVRGCSLKIVSENFILSKKGPRDFFHIYQIERDTENVHF